MILVAITIFVSSFLMLVVMGSGKEPPGMYGRIMGTICIGSGVYLVISAVAGLASLIVELI